LRIHKDVEDRALIVDSYGGITRGSCTGGLAGLNNKAAVEKTNEIEVSNIEKVMLDAVEGYQVRISVRVSHGPGDAQFGAASFGVLRANEGAVPVNGLSCDWAAE